MDLSYIRDHIDQEAAIIREGYFDYLGIIGNTSGNLLLYMDNPSFVGKLGENAEVCLLCNEAVREAVGERPYGMCVVKNPKEVFYKLHNHLVEETDFYTKMAGKNIAPTCRIDKSAVIQDGVSIGERTVIEPNVTIYGNTVIGNDVIIRAGSVIGSEGFQFQRTGGGITGIRHAGRVIVGNHVEIQANCCIDKAVFNDATTIGEYCKLDNLVHIAHNVKIGARTMLAANAVVAGYTRIGDDVWVGPCATISNSLRIGNNVRITIGTVVTKDVQDGETVYLPRQQVSMPNSKGWED